MHDNLDGSIPLIHRACIRHESRHRPGSATGRQNDHYGCSLPVWRSRRPALKILPETPGRCAFPGLVAPIETSGPKAPAWRDSGGRYRMSCLRKEPDAPGPPAAARPGDELVPALRTVGEPRHAVVRWSRPAGFPRIRSGPPGLTGSAYLPISSAATRGGGGRTDRVGGQLHLSPLTCTSTPIDMLSHCSIGAIKSQASRKCSARPGRPGV